MSDLPNHTLVYNTQTLYLQSVLDSFFTFGRECGIKGMSVYMVAGVSTCVPSSLSMMAVYHQEFHTSKVHAYLLQTTTKPVSQ